MLKRAWWVSNYLGGSEFCKSVDHPSHLGNWFGPFTNLAAAKRDAVAYHRATARAAYSAIRGIGSVRARDFTGEK